MSKTSQTSRVDLLKEVKSNVNAVSFSPTESRKADALKSIDTLRSFVEAIDLPKPKATKSKSKPKVTKSDDMMAELLKQFLLSNPSLLEKLTDDEPPFEPDPKPKAKRVKKAKVKAAVKAAKVKSPRRNTTDGVEQAQAKTTTSKDVGSVKRTKVVHAVTGGDAMPLEPRKEVTLPETKSRKQEAMLTLLEGETPQEAMARHRSAQIEAERIEAEALIADTAPNMMEPSFAPAV